VGFLLRRILVLVPSRIQHFPQPHDFSRCPVEKRLRRCEDANRTWPVGASRFRGDLHIPCFSISVRGGGIPHLAFRGKYYALVTPERGRSEITVPFPTAALRLAVIPSWFSAASPAFLPSPPSPARIIGHPKCARREMDFQCAGPRHVRFSPRTGDFSSSELSHTSRRVVGEREREGEKGRSASAWFRGTPHALADFSGQLRRALRHGFPGEFLANPVRGRSREVRGARVVRASTPRTESTTGC